jgi:hypothetical protein
MKVSFGKFARTSMQAQLGTDLAVAARTALVHYERRLRSHWPPVGPPRFLPEENEIDAKVLDLPVDPEMEAFLEREARKQRVTVEEILAHALLVYLADMDKAPQHGVAAVSIG